MSNLVSKQCVDFVKSFEGFSATPYFCEAGVKTIGYGMTGAEIEGLTSITEEQASIMLEDLLNNKYATPLKADLDSKGVRLNQNQFDALVSMAYNVGVSGVLGSTLYRNVVSGIIDKETITSNFQAWCNAGGKRLEGLYRRRTEEAEMFFDGGNDMQNNEALKDYNMDTGELQWKLNWRGYGCTQTKKWDEQTQNALKRFQNDAHLHVTGYLNLETAQALNSYDYTAYDVLVSGVDQITASKVAELLRSNGYNSVIK